MDARVALIHQALSKLMGLHRQLVEVVRQEHEALVQADIKAIQEATMAKQGLIEAIRQAEAERIKRTTELAAYWKKPVRELTLPNLIIAIQGDDLKGAEQLRSSYNALTILVQRIQEQNRANQALVEKSLEHIQAMKNNVLGEAKEASSTYTQKGSRTSTAGSSRLISKEA